VNKRLALFCAVCGIFQLPTIGLAASHTVSYSGRLSDGTGWGLSMVVDMTFWLCDGPSGSTLGCLWSEAHQNVALQDGFFSVELGNSQPLPQPLPPHLWLAASVDGTSELSPWVKVGAVPYALQAREVAPEASSQSVLKAMKLALGYSDSPSDPNYLSDAAFISHQRGECPVGYARDSTGDNANYVVCKKGLDEIVKVGDFWVDRYEMSLWETRECGGEQYGLGDGDAHDAGFGRNGSAVSKRLFACSIPGATSSCRLTWFQAQRACTESGKRLCTDAEWQAAALGTPDPHADDPGDDSEACNVWSGSKPEGSVFAGPSGSILTGTAALCKSAFGAFDMVGNVWEWTSDWWGQGPNDADGFQLAEEYYQDGYWNIDPGQKGGTYVGGTPTFPAVAVRGGAYYGGKTAGVFAITLDNAPSYSSGNVGARCCLR